MKCNILVHKVTYCQITIDMVSKVQNFIPTPTSHVDKLLHVALVIDHVFAQLCHLPPCWSQGDWIESPERSDGSQKLCLRDFPLPHPNPHQMFT